MSLFANKTSKHPSLIPVHMLYVAPCNHGDIRLIGDNCVLVPFNDPKTAVTFTRGHFNQVVFAVYIYMSYFEEKVSCYNLSLENDLKINGPVSPL